MDFLTFLIHMKKKSSIIGFSATPIRTKHLNRNRLQDIYNNNVISLYNLRYCINKKIIVPPKFISISSDDEEFGGLSPQQVKLRRMNTIDRIELAKKESLKTLKKKKPAYKPKPKPKLKPKPKPAVLKSFSQLSSDSE